MHTQIIGKSGKKEYAVIPYKEFLRMQEMIEDYEDLKALRRAKAEPDYRKRRPYEDVAKELGLVK
ncbi:MAG TPA: type II toxin-antitoxin system Phd/YefM family antitoxin [Planctomycetota bacterium]|jgi:PHD/YefM family antitoxin component YafN of YafNO toxin-antitoxin module